MSTKHKSLGGDRGKAKQSMLKIASPDADCSSIMAEARDSIVMLRTWWFDAQFLFIATKVLSMLDLLLNSRAEKVESHRTVPEYMATKLKDEASWASLFAQSLLCGQCARLYCLLS